MASLLFPAAKLLGQFQNGAKTYSIDTTHEAISNLKLIAKIKKNHKINVNGKIHIQPITILTGIHRWYNREDRQKSFDFIKDVIDRILTILEARKQKPEELMFCVSLINDLIGAMEGLKAIQYTYSSDENYHSSIQTLIESIERTLSVYQRDNPELFKLLDQSPPFSPPSAPPQPPNTQLPNTQPSTEDSSMLPKRKLKDPKDS